MEAMLDVVARDGEAMKVDASEEACLKHRFKSGDVVMTPHGEAVTIRGEAPAPKGSKYYGQKVLWYEKKDGYVYYFAAGNLREHGFSLIKSTGDKSEWISEALIDRFERDIIYNCHGYTARFERSKAMRELHKRGREVLRPIIEHLKRKPPTSFMNLDCAWGHLLNWIEVNIDPDKSGPQDRRDTAGWVRWAEKFAA